MSETARERWRRLFAAQKEKKLVWLVALGLCGMLLIALSEWLPRDVADEPSLSVAVSSAAVETALEERITALVSQVAGVGSCHVLVTLESGSRYVYAAEQSYSVDENRHAASEKTLLVETDTGPVGLLVAELQPTVKGVAVVCAGGGDPTVCERVTNLICAAFNISSGRVCVVKQQ